MSKLMKNVNYLNDVLTVLSSNQNVYVTVTGNVRGGLKEYEVTYGEDDTKKQVKIVFDASTVCIDGHTFTKSGYMKFKLACLQHELGNCIKNQQRQYAQDVVRSQWSEKIQHWKRQIKMRLANHFLGRNLGW